MITNEEQYNSIYIYILLKEKGNPCDYMLILDKCLIYDEGTPDKNMVKEKSFIQGTQIPENLLL